MPYFPRPFLEAVDQLENNLARLLSREDQKKINEKKGLSFEKSPAEDTDDFAARQCYLMVQDFKKAIPSLSKANFISIETAFVIKKIYNHFEKVSSKKIGSFFSAGLRMQLVVVAFKNFMMQLQQLEELKDINLSHSKESKEKNAIILLRDDIPSLSKIFSLFGFKAINKSEINTKLEDSINYMIDSNDILKTISTLKIKFDLINLASSSIKESKEKNEKQLSDKIKLVKLSKSFDQDLNIINKRIMNISLLIGDMVETLFKKEIDWIAKVKIELEIIRSQHKESFDSLKEPVKPKLLSLKIFDLAAIQELSISHDPPPAGGSRLSPTKSS